jgi:hypothetical protein
MRRFALLSLLFASAAGAQPIDPAGASDTEVIRGNVVVWHDATFYTSPSEDASTARVATLGPRRENAGHVIAMRAVATHGAFVEVELVDDAGCTWSKMSTNDDIAKLHLFVKRADLAPVLTKPFDKTFADGTRIALRPGVPVVPSANGFAVSVRGHLVEAEIPAASVGHAYASEKAKALAVTAHEYAVTGKATLGEQSLALDGLRAVASEKRDASALVTFDDRCMSLAVLAPSKAVRQLDDEEAEVSGGGGLATLDLRDSNYIPQATPLASGSGRQIAYAAKPIYLMAAPSGKNACIDRRVRLTTVVAGAPAVDAGDVDDHVRLCAPSSKVVHEKMRSARSANGSFGR